MRPRVNGARRQRIGIDPIALVPPAHTPTYRSWLNQVELWFAKIERDVIARGIFTSVTDLARKLWRYIRQYNHTATPFRWSYADPSRRIRALSNS